MKKVLLAVFGFVFLSFITDNNKITWKQDQPLKWSDFKGKHDPKDELQALTYTEISLKTLDHPSADSMMFSIECTFDRTKSSVMKGKETDSLLKHEQGHFDLGEIYTREMRKAIKSTVFHEKTVSEQINKIYKQYFDAYNKEQDKYDSETNHSMEEVKQTQWNKKIHDRLSDLKSYSNAIIVVGMKK